MLMEREELFGCSYLCCFFALDCTGNQLQGPMSEREYIVSTGTVSSGKHCTKHQILNHSVQCDDRGQRHEHRLSRGLNT